MPTRKYWLGIFVGINNYFRPDGQVNTSFSLEYASQDALRTCRSAVNYFRIDEPVLIADIPQSSIRPTRNNIVANVLEATGRANQARPLIFFFSGHGGDVEGNSLLFPSDYDSRIPVFSSISLSWLLDVLSSRTGQTLFVLDNCRVSVERPYKEVRKTNQLNGLPRDNCILLMSCKKGYVSYESSLINGGGGVFANSFCEILDGSRSKRGRENKKLLSLFELVSEDMKNKLAFLSEFSESELVQEPDISGASYHTCELD